MMSPIASTIAGESSFRVKRGNPSWFFEVAPEGEGFHAPLGMTVFSYFEKL
jgi:hypothetical protein